MSSRGIVVGDSSGMMSWPARGGSRKWFVCAPMLPRRTFAPPGESSTGDVAGRRDGDGRGGADVAPVRSSSASSTVAGALQHLAQQDVDRRAGRDRRRGRAQQVQADAEAGVVEADLGQHAGLGQRREPAAVRARRSRSRSSRAGPGASPSSARAGRRRRPRSIRRARAGQDLGAGVDREQLVLVDSRPAAIPAISSRASSGTRSARQLVGVDAVGLGEHPPVDGDRVLDGGRLRAAERLAALARVGSSERWTGKVMHHPACHIAVRREPHRARSRIRRSSVPAARPGARARSPRDASCR